MILSLNMLRRAEHMLASACGAALQVVGALGLRYAAVLPPCMAGFVAISRVHDNWHSPADVVTGASLGALCGAFAAHLEVLATSQRRRAIGAGDLSMEPMLPIRIISSPAESPAPAPATV